jgi:hypothetical protein
MKTKWNDPGIISFFEIDPMDERQVRLIALRHNPSAIMRALWPPVDRHPLCLVVLHEQCEWVGENDHQPPDRQRNILMIIRAKARGAAQVRRLLKPTNY